MRGFGDVERRNSDYVGKGMVRLELPGKTLRGRKQEDIHGHHDKAHGGSGVKEKDAEEWA